MLMFSDCIPVNDVTGKLKLSAKHFHPTLTVREPSLHPDPQRVLRCEAASLLTLLRAHGMSPSAFPQPN